MCRVESISAKVGTSPNANTTRPTTIVPPMFSTTVFTDLLGKAPPNTELLPRGSFRNHDPKYDPGHSQKPTASPLSTCKISWKIVNKFVTLCVCVCVCMCVWERERQRQRQKAVRIILSVIEEKCSIYVNTFLQSSVSKSHKASKYAPIPSGLWRYISHLLTYLLNVQAR